MGAGLVWQRSTPAVRREAMRLVDSGASPAQVAAQLGFAETTVRSWMRRRR